LSGTPRGEAAQPDRVGRRKKHNVGEGRWDC
jgi:hypothetical protein